MKWWTQFDSSKADPKQVKLWFQSHPKLLKAADPETSIFLNQKSQLVAFLAGSKSKESLAENLKRSSPSATARRRRLFLKEGRNKFI